VAILNKVCVLVNGIDILIYLTAEFCNNDHKDRKGQAKTNSREVPSTSYADAER